MNHSTKPEPNAVVTRRSFLKSTAVAGGTLLSALPIARFAHAASPGDTVRVALVGCGGRGNGAAAQALKACKQAKLVAVCDAFADKPGRAIKEISGAVKENERIMVDDDHKFVGMEAYQQAISTADVVILATPPGLRSIMFEEAVRQGKHVFMEKPVAVDGPGVRRVIAAAAEATKKNLKVAVGLQRRHQPNYIETVARLQDGAIGDILDMRVYWNGGPVGPKAKRADLEKSMGRPPTEMEYQVRNWYMFNWLCGDHIVEQHIHNLDVANWVLKGYPIRASGMGGRAFQKGPDSGEIFDHHAVEYEYANGVRVFSQCRQIPGCSSSVTEYAAGTKGKCDISGFRIVSGDSSWRWKATQETPEGMPGPGDGWGLEHFPFFDAILNDKPYNEAERGAKSSLTAIMGRMATNGGNPVEWEAALNSKIDLLPESLSFDAKPKVRPGPDGLYPFAIPGKTVVV
ncbi:MAG: myo-inositol 2-dehydrogenase / D-chiro-inositol 1-dehydrogenase [Verrucomicrobiota bacterium]|jgi:predicted dehydrogenase